MFSKIFNFFLALVFLLLVALFAYKTARKPNVLKANVNQESSVDENNIVNYNHANKKEINALIKDYILNHPEDIIASLEKMQKMKSQKSMQNITEYLKNNLKSIRSAGSPPVLGNSEGDISIIFFYDYNCSYCKKANQQTNKILESDSGVKIILRPFPILGEGSIYASKVILAVEKMAKDKFHLIHDEIMSKKSINKESIKELALKYEIDYLALENEINSYGVQQLINQNFEFAKNLGVKGAPYYIINDQIFPGLISADKLEAIIFEIRSRSKKGKKQD